MNIKIKNIFKNITVILVILSIFMSSSINIVNAVITTNLPVSEIKYDASNNSSVFPDSYKQYINNLKSAHPNWIFKAVNTKLDFNESIRQESYEVKTGISTVPSSYSANWKKDGLNNFVDGSFVIASKKAVAYTMDPRNFLNDTGIFQFEALDYTNETSTTAAIDKIFLNTPIATYPTKYKKAGNMVDLENSMSWSSIIINAGKNAGGNGVSAVHLASRMLQETSADIINNGSANGSAQGYEGIYNFFNIGSTPNADGTGSVINGLKASLAKGWTTPEKCITGSAVALWSSYIQWGQNTVYFQKFDVSNVYGNAKMLYGFQYMTNILAPSSESKITYSAYSKASMIDAPFVFYIPVYDNMPSVVSAHPDSEVNTYAITGTDIVYMDDVVSNGTDFFNVRSGAGSEYNIIAQIVESSEGVENRTKFVRTQIGTNGWDKIRLSDGTEGYVSQSYVKEYNYIHVNSISFAPNTVNLKVGENRTLVANISPANSYIKNINWNSSNSNVATVDNSGKIFALAVGTTNITATTLDGSKVAICTVTVDKTLALSIATTSNEYSLVIGNYLGLNPVVLPITTTDKSYDISITDNTVATVENGKIKGLKVGNSLVTLTTKDGSNKSCSFNLKVIESVAKVNTYTVNNSGIITKVPIGAIVSSVKGNIVTSYSKKIVNVSLATLNDTDKVGTGSKVQILNGTDVLQEYPIVIYGDVNGDTKISSSDYVLIKNYIMISKTTLDNIQELGADYNNDGKVSSSDYVLIKNYIMQN